MSFRYERIYFTVGWRWRSTNLKISDIWNSFNYAYVFLSICLCVPLDFSFFVGCFISALMSFYQRSIYVLIVWCVSFGFHFSLFLIIRATCLFGWFIVVMQLSSLKLALNLISQMKFCQSKDNWFLLYLFEVGMKLRFLSRSFYV